MFQAPFRTMGYLKGSSGTRCMSTGQNPCSPPPHCETCVLIGRFLWLRKHNDNNRKFGSTLYCVNPTTLKHFFFPGYFKIHFQLVSARSSVKVIACFFIYFSLERALTQFPVNKNEDLTKVYPFGLHYSFPQRTGHIFIGIKWDVMMIFSFSFH